MKSGNECFGKEEPHSSLLCLFVLLLVVDRVVFPLPLLSDGAFIANGQHHGCHAPLTIVCVFCGFEGQELTQHSKPFQRMGHSHCCGFLIETIHFDTFIRVCIGMVEMVVVGFGVLEERSRGKRSGFGALLATLPFPPILGISFLF